MRKRFVVILIFMLTLCLVSLYSEIYGKELTFTSHEMNYIIPMSHYTSPKGEFTEIKYQISIEKLFAQYAGWKLVGAYTQRAYWDFYNDRQTSRSFRETNYNPKLVIRPPVLSKFETAIGYWHESNGQISAYTRSWDRFYIDLKYDFGFLTTRILYWDIFKTENKDLEFYVGKMEISTMIKFNDIWINPKLNKGYTEITLSVPAVIFEDSYWIYQYRNGYYDCMYDYGKAITRHGVGLAINR